MGFFLRLCCLRLHLVTFARIIALNLCSDGMVMCKRGADIFRSPIKRGKHLFFSQNKVWKTFSFFFFNFSFWASFQRHYGVFLYRLDWIQGSLAVKAHCFADSHSNQTNASDFIVILHTEMDKPIVLWGGEMELSLANNLFIFKNWKKFTFVYFLLWIWSISVFHNHFLTCK